MKPSLFERLTGRGNRQQPPPPNSSAGKPAEPSRGRTGIVLGYKRSAPKNNAPWVKLAYDGDRHVITVAPTRSGKATTTIIPSLLEHRSSMFITDPKGELAAVTARHRRDRLGHKVHILNPFGVLGEEFTSRGFKASCFNPLAQLDPRGASFVSDVARLGEALIYSEGKEPHWANSARDLISCFIMLVCLEEGTPRTLGEVRGMLTGNPTRYMEAIKQRMPAVDFGPLTQRASRFEKDTTEMHNIVSTAITQTSFLDDPAIAASTSRSDFRFIDLKRADVTVYLVLSAKDVAPYAKWLRLLLTSALDELMATEEKGAYPVLFVLDEFANLGQLTVIETAMSLAAGYGVQCWPIVQDLNQLEGIYQQKWETFLANAGVTQYFAPNDMKTAEYLSKRCGVTTIDVVGKSFHEISIEQAKHGFTGEGSSVSRQQRPLYFPTELYGLDPSQQIIFHAGVSEPIFAARAPYFRTPAPQNGITDYSGLYDPNPYHQQRQQQTV